MNLLSWLDIERILASKTQNFAHLPDSISDIRTYSDAVEIDFTHGKEASATEFLQNIFGSKWQEADEKKRILLSYDDDASLEVNFAEDTQRSPRTVKPLWKDLGYASTSPLLPTSLESPTGKTKIAAFHSFKGGVGRTTSLLTWFVALMKQFHQQKNKNCDHLKVLLVDADLEAPGLTYLYKPSDRPKVSWIQFLEASHYPPVENTKVIKFFADELNSFSKAVAGIEVCLLPAFSDTANMGMTQLMDISVRPEHLANSLDHPWRCTDILQQLGKELGADLILVDLRAGLSELSSPLLFDPRVERFIVTTLSEQSVQGTEFVLERLAALASDSEWRRKFGAQTLDPRVIATFVTEEFRKTPRYKDSLERLNKAYTVDTIEGVNATEGLEIIEGEFSSQMLNLGQWENTLNVIETGNPLLAEALKWAKNLLSQEDIAPSRPESTDQDTQAQLLNDLSSRLVYAEKGTTKELLLTAPLRNLAQRHKKDLPKIVSIGAKGAGKTFNYVQLCHRITWNKFLDDAGINFDQSLSKRLKHTYILPHIGSSNVEGAAFEAIKKARSTFYSRAKTSPYFTSSAFRKNLKAAKRENGTDWELFWEKELIALHGLDTEQTPDFESLAEWLNKKELQTVIIIDGLEDEFDKVGKDEAENAAIKALLHIPNRLREINHCPIGIIILIREDYVEAVTPQNVGQFRSLYESYQLVWDADAFLQLVYWICHQAALDFAKEPVDKLITKEISAKLHGLWGLKLGKPASREAYSVRWVYAALCDLKGRLQARDIVRFLKYSSEKALSNDNRTAWMDRVLPPQSMRDSMAKCSKEKVEEAKNELAVLKEWIKQLNGVDSDLKTIPFSAKDIGLKPEELNRLIEYGIVYEDTRMDDSKRYYLPESYRQGLEFSMSRGGRPKVQAMLKSSLGKLPVDL